MSEPVQLRDVTSLGDGRAHEHLCRHLGLCGAAACAAMLGAPPLCVDPLCREAVRRGLTAFV